MAFCIQCGKELPAGAPFCHQCGAKQGENAGTQVQQGAAPSPAVMHMSPPTPMQKKPEKKNSNKGLIIGLVCGGVALVAGIVVLLVFLLGGKKEDPASVSGTTASPAVNTSATESSTTEIPTEPVSAWPDGLFGEYTCIFLGAEDAPPSVSYNILFYEPFGKGYLRTDAYEGEFSASLKAYHELLLEGDDGTKMNCMFHENGALDLIANGNLYTFATYDSEEYAAYLERMSEASDKAPEEEDIFGEWVSERGFCMEIEEGLTYRYYSDEGVLLTYGSLQGTPGGPGTLCYNASNDRGGAPVFLTFSYGPGEYIELRLDLDEGVYSKRVMDGGGPDDSDRSHLQEMDKLLLGSFISDDQIPHELTIVEAGVHAGGYKIFLTLCNENKPEGDAYEDYAICIFEDPDVPVGHLEFFDMMGEDGFLISGTIAVTDDGGLELTLTKAEHPYFSAYVSHPIYFSRQ